MAGARFDSGSVRDEKVANRSEGFPGDRRGMQEFGRRELEMVATPHKKNSPEKRVATVP